MELLASCSLERSRTFNGTLSLPNEDKKVNDKVSLNIVIDNAEDCNVVFSSLSGLERCVTFTGEKKATYCPTNLEGKVFNEYTIEDALNGRIEPIMGVVDLVRVPEGYCDMRQVKTYCSKYPSVRFIGGNLLNIEGVRIGRYDKGKDKMSPVLCDMQDTFVEVNLDDLNGIQEKVKKVRIKAEKLAKEPKKKSSGNGGGNNKKKEKRVAAFSGLFGTEEVAF